MTGYHFAMPGRLLLAAVLAFPLLAFAQEQAFTNRSTELKERGAPEARTLATLDENVSVKVMARGGGWTRVEASGQSGFVRVFHLRFPGSVAPAAAGSGAGGLLSSLGSAISGQRADPKVNLATTGVRGLSKEELHNASPDPEQVRRLQGYRTDRAAAERFAREGKLAAVRVDAPDAGGGR
jgi:hypothetical protein